MIWRKFIWDRIQIYFPLLILGVLALLTYWMARTTEQAPQATVQSTHPDHTPDYFATALFLQHFDLNGSPTMQLQGVSAKHYPDTKELVIQQLHLINTNIDRKETIATANTGSINDAQTDILLTGNVHVIHTSQTNNPADHAAPSALVTQYWGNRLNYYPNTQIVTSNEPVRIQKGSDQFSANALSYDSNSQKIKMTGRVQVIIPSSRQAN